MKRLQSTVPLPTESAVQKGLLLLLGNGRLQTQAAYHCLADQMKITAVQRGATLTSASGRENAWENLVRFARRHLVDRGWLSPPNHSGRGCWELTAEGRREADRLRSFNDYIAEHGIDF